MPMGGTPLQRLQDALQHTCSTLLNQSASRMCHAMHIEPGPQALLERERWCQQINVHLPLGTIFVDKYPKWLLSHGFFILL